MAALGTPVAYYSDESTGTFADGDPVVTLGDRLGTSPTMTQASSTFQPTWVEGQRAYLFNNDEFSSGDAAFQVLHKGGFCVAWRYRNNGGSSRGVFGNSRVTSAPGIGIYRQPTQIHMLCHTGSSRIRTVIANVDTRQGMHHWCVVTGDENDVQVWFDGVLVKTVSGLVTLPTADGPDYTIGRLQSAFPSNDHIGAMMVWSSRITDQADIDAVGEELFATRTRGLNQVFQRSSGGTGTIRMRGNYRPETFPGGLEARYDGGSWTAVTTSPDGTWTWTLTGVATGQGLFEVRDTATGVTYEPLTQTVGVGDVIAIYGQSNALGQAQSSDTVGGLTWSTADGRRVLSGTLATIHNPYTTTAVPTRWNITSLSSWPSLIEDYTADTGVPVMVIVSGQGATRIERFTPTSSFVATNDPSTTLYDQMVSLVLESQGLDSRTTEDVCRCVCFVQGESDSNAGVTTAAYESDLNEIVNGIAADLGCQTGVPIMAQIGLGSASEQQQIRDAQINVRASNANAFEGPDDSGLTLTGDGVHYFTTSERDGYGVRWSDAIQAGTTL